MAERFVDDYLLYLLARASHQASRQFHQVVKAHGLKVPEWRVLARLADGPCTIGELAAVTLIEQPTLTKIVDRMSARGWVERRGHPEDGRKVLVAGTAGGLKRIATLLPLARAHERELLARYAPDDGQALKRTLHELIRRTA